MNPNKLKRLFPHASKDFERLNSNMAEDKGMSGESEQMDRERTSEALGGKEMGAQYRLRHVDIVFFASHGKRLDEDNRRYISKPILDALVNLGFAGDDKDITSETTQRMDGNNT